MTAVASDEVADEMVDEMADEVVGRVAVKAGDKVRVEAVDAALHAVAVLSTVPPWTTPTAPSTVALIITLHGSRCVRHPRPPVDSPRAIVA